MGWAPNADLQIARKAVTETLTPDRHMRCNCREEIERGEWDKGHKIQACLRAIHLTRHDSRKGEA